MNNRRKVGRPFSEEETAEARLEVRLRPSEYERLKARRDETGVPIGTYIKQLVQRDLDGNTPDTPQPTGLTLELSDSQIARISNFARPLGYREVTHFIEDLALRAITKPPREVTEFMIGEFLDAAAAHVAAQEQDTEATGTEMPVHDQPVHDAAEHPPRRERKGKRAA